MTIESGILYVAATPLGNLGDISERLTQVLRHCDVVAAEDTRRARTLLNHVGAHPKLLSFHANSPPNRLQSLRKLLLEGKTVVTLTDAGTPTISDPGRTLVEAAREMGVNVLAVPGPSAVTAALSVSGLPADRFTFLGFLPRKGGERSRRLEEIAKSRWTVVLFEAPSRLARLIADLQESCGSERRIVVARELTKLHEEVRSGTLAEIAGYYADNAPRGEVTIVVSGCPTRPKEKPEAAVLAQRAKELIDEGGTRRDVAAALAKEYGLPRKDVYRMVSEL